MVAINGIGSDAFLRHHRRRGCRRGSRHRFGSCGAGRDLLPGEIQPESLTLGFHGISVKTWEMTIKAHHRCFLQSDLSPEFAGPEDGVSRRAAKEENNYGHVKLHCGTAVGGFVAGTWRKKFQKERFNFFANKNVCAEFRQSAFHCQGIDFLDL